MLTMLRRVKIEGRFVADDDEGSGRLIKTLKAGDQRLPKNIEPNGVLEEEQGLGNGFGST